MSAVVFLENNAFLSILIASIEKFPATHLPRNEKLSNDRKLEGESYGLLFGQKIAKDSGSVVYNVSMAIPMQVVRSVDSGSVSISHAHYERIADVLGMYPNLSVLGSYHSHPWKVDEFSKATCTQLSGEDGDVGRFRCEAEMLCADSVHIVLGLTKLSKLMKSSTPTYANSWISSHFGHWKYKAHAYCFDIAADEARQVHNFICPAASGMQNFDLSN